MKKTLLLATITIFLFWAGCGKVATNNVDKKSPSTTPPAALVTTRNEIDYNQYIKKTWVEKKDTFHVASFSISKIENGKLTGRFNSDMPASPDPYDLGHLTGKVNKDTAICQFSDEIGNKGNIKLVFKPNNEMEATIKLTAKSKFIEQIPKEGTFQYIPYNLYDMKEYSVIKDQSFMVDLDSWGKIKFVSAKLMGSIHEPPVEFFLTNEDGDILFEFEPGLPYGLDVKAVSFKDVNKDGLKDIIIILADNYDGPGDSLATVYLQKVNGLFTYDSKLFQEINDFGYNKDVKTVIKYLSQNTSPVLASFFGEWKTKKRLIIPRYNSEEDLKQNNIVGKKVIIKSNIFSIANMQYKNPYYKISNITNQEFGDDNIGTFTNGSLHKLKIIDKSTITKLDVFSDKSSEFPIIIFYLDDKNTIIANNDFGAMYELKRIK